VLGDGSPSSTVRQAELLAPTPCGLEGTPGPLGYLGGPKEVNKSIFGRCPGAAGLGRAGAEPAVRLTPLAAGLW